MTGIVHPQTVWADAVQREALHWVVKSVNRKETCVPLSGISPALLLCIVAPWKTSVVLSFPLFLETFTPKLPRSPV